MSEKEQIMTNYTPGQRVVFRENESGPAEQGIIVDSLPADDSHPNGGEYDLLLDDGSGVTAWVGELEAA